jgi:hypothetical protein
MAAERKKIVIHLSQAEISRQAMMEAGYDPVRFGKRQRSTVETDRKKASKRGYQKHKSRDASADYADSRTRDAGPFFLVLMRRFPVQCRSQHRCEAR